VYKGQGHIPGGLLNQDPYKAFLVETETNNFQGSVPTLKLMERRYNRSYTYGLRMEIITSKCFPTCFRSGRAVLVVVCIQAIMYCINYSKTAPVLILVSTIGTASNTQLFQQDTNTEYQLTTASKQHVKQVIKQTHGVVRSLLQ